jgi:hypothetical protein
MISLTNKRTGAAGSTFWNIELNGLVVATLQHGKEAFAKWYVNRNDDVAAFPSKAAALAYAVAK